MKVLLVYSNVMPQAWVPIGLLYIASNLRKNNIEVKIIDSKFDNVIKEVDDYKPDIVGLGGMTLMAHDAINWGLIIKEKYPWIFIIFGGVHFTFLPNEAKNIADIVIKGEAENVFLELCKKDIFINKMDRKQNTTSNYFEIVEGHSLIKDLDSLPFPAYDLININKYSDELVTGEKAISILTGRGCPYNCSFCASPALWKRKCRFHSIEYTIDYIKFLIKKYDVKNLRIMDDTFTVNNDRVLQFCEAIQKNNIKLNMTCLTNVHNADYEVFKEMKKTGFSIVAFGMESVDPIVLNLCNKDQNKNMMRSAVEKAHKAELLTELLFMVGNMGDTKKSLRDSLEFSKSLNSFKVYFQLATPFPGCEFYNKAEEYGKVISRDWKNYNHKKITYIPYGLDEVTMYETIKEGCVN